LQKIAVSKGANQTVAGLVLAAKDVSIRKIGSARAKAEIILKLPNIAAAYGARQEIPIDTLKETARFICERFPELSIDEILQAYRLWAGGELGDEVTEMYGGQFNVKHFGSVLVAYKEYYRKPALAAIAKSEKDIESRQLEAMAKQKVSEYVKQFPAMIEGWKEKGWTWKKVPLMVYETAIELGMIPELDKEAKKSYMEQARIEVKRIQESEKENTEALGRYYEARAIKDKDIDGIIKQTAKKMIVADYLLK